MRGAEGCLEFALFSRLQCRVAHNSLDCSDTKFMLLLMMNKLSDRVTGGPVYRRASAVFATTLVHSLFGE